MPMRDQNNGNQDLDLKFVVLMSVIGDSHGIPLAVRVQSFLFVYF